MAAFSFYVDSNSYYTPVIGANSVNFNRYVNNGGRYDQTYACVHSNETFTGKVIINYDVVITTIGWQLRFRITPSWIIGGDGGYFTWYDAVDTPRIFYDSAYHETVGTTFHVKETWDNTTGIHTWVTTLSGGGSITVSRAFTPQAIRLHFSSGDSPGWQHSPVNITNIMVSSAEDVKPRSFGMIL